MNITFDLGSTAGLARTGRVRWKPEGAVTANTARTPAFVPRLHPSLLAFPPYKETLASLVDRGKVQALVVPAGFDPGDDRDVSSLLGRILLFETTTVEGLTAGSPALANALILIHPFISQAFPDEMNDHHANVMLERARVVDPALGRRCAIEAFNASSVSLDKTDPFWGVASSGLRIERVDEAMIGRTIDLARMRPDVCRILHAPVAPHELAHVTGMGYDIVIERGILPAASAGAYRTSDGVDGIDHLPPGEALPCPCVHCEALERIDAGKRGTIEARLRVYIHDLVVAVDEMARIRRCLQDGTFRDRMERQVHGGTHLSVLQRRIDRAAASIYEQRVNLASTAKITFTGTESYHRPEIVAFRAKLRAHAHLPASTRCIVLLPCSARKPYSQSPSHARFSQAMARGWAGWRGSCHEIIVTSPIGIVPRGLERCFPAAHYDVPVTGYWDEQELAFPGDMLVDLVCRHVPVHGTVARVIAHLDGGYKEAIEKAAGKLPVPVVFTGDFSSASSKEALALLEAAMRETSEILNDQGGKPSNVRPLVEDLRMVVDFQFETRLGRHLVPEDIVARTAHGSFLEVRRPANRDLLFRRDDRHGYVMLEDEGMRVAWDAASRDPDVHLKTVTFCEKEITGSNLFPGGIDAADVDIKVGDDVFIQDTAGLLLGAGKALVSGTMMLAMTRGAAVRVSLKARRGRA